MSSQSKELLILVPIRRKPVERIEDKAYEKATKEVPTQIWQQATALKTLGALGALCGLYICRPQDWGTLQDYWNTDLPAHVVSAFLYVTGAVSGRASTIKLFDTMSSANKKGIPISHGRPEAFSEGANPAEAYKNNKGKLKRDMSLSALSAVVPAIGFGMGTSRMVAAASNFRTAHRYDRAINIIDQQFAKKNL